MRLRSSSENVVWACVRLNLFVRYIMKLPTPYINIYKVYHIIQANEKHYARIGISMKICALKCKQINGKCAEI